MSLVTVHNFDDVNDAMLAKAKLESAGISAQLHGYNSARAYYVTSWVGGIPVLVPEEQAEEASKLIQEFVQDLYGS